MPFYKYHRSKAFQRETLHDSQIRFLYKSALKSKLEEVTMRLKPPLIRAKHVSPQAQKKGRDGTLAILGVADNNVVQGCV